MYKIKHILEFDSFDDELAKKFKRTRYISRSEKDKLNKTGLKFDEIEKIFNASSVCYDFFKMQDIETLNIFLSDLSDDVDVIDLYYEYPEYYKKINFGIDYQMNGYKPSNGNQFDWCGGEKDNIIISDTFFPKDAYEIASSIIESIQKNQRNKISSLEEDYKKSIERKYPYEEENHARKYQKIDKDDLEREKRKKITSIRIFPYINIPLFLNVTDDFLYRENGLKYLPQESYYKVRKSLVDLSVKLEETMIRYFTSIGVKCRIRINSSNQTFYDNLGKVDLTTTGKGIVTFKIIVDPYSLEEYSDKL